MLSDAQYLLAYEAIAIAAFDEKVIASHDVYYTLELYFNEYAPKLLDGIPSDSDSLMHDLAIGPLTTATGSFAFVHDILAAYFFARRLARTLMSRGRELGDLWNRRIEESTWSFLKEAVARVVNERRIDIGILQELGRAHSSGLMLFNVANSIGGALPVEVFEGKYMSGITFHSMDLSGLSFESCNMHDVGFIRSKLRGTIFRRAKIGRIRFVECDKGAIFDGDPALAEDAEVVLVRREGEGEEVYTGEGIKRALSVMSDEGEALNELPDNVGEQGVVVVFNSLFKSDGRRDYPEVRKIENRLRAWLAEYRVDEKTRAQLLRSLMEVVNKLMGGWICRNPNRPRTLVPCDTRAQEVAEVVRLGKIPVHCERLREMACEVSR
jgi:hypothetical protein